MQNTIAVYCRVLAIFLVFAVFDCTGACAEKANSTPAQAGSGTYIEAREAGYETYIDACASCHGAFGYGDGQFADTLDKAPSNLTQLSKNNGGVFPWVRVYEIIDGRKSVASHGSRDMPIWGEVWSRTLATQNARYADVYVRGRILELMLYLDSIQET